MVPKTTWLPNSQYLVLFFCSKKDIPKQNYDIHEIHCRRNLRLCKKCEEPFPISEMDEHMDEYHALVECKCKVKVEKSQLEKHEVESCIRSESILFSFDACKCMSFSLKLSS